MWKYVWIVFIDLVSLEVWKCGNVEMWKYVWIVFIDLVSVEVWKCGSVEVWKCGNVEICLDCLY